MLLRSHLGNAGWRIYCMWPVTVGVKQSSRPCFCPRNLSLLCRLCASVLFFFHFICSDVLFSSFALFGFIVFFLIIIPLLRCHFGKHPSRDPGIISAFLRLLNCGTHIICIINKYAIKAPSFVPSHQHASRFPQA